MMDGPGATKPPDRKVKNIQLFFGQDDQKRLDQNQRLPQTGIQVKMTCIQG